MRPVLAEHCYKCHSAGAKALKGGLRLDSLDGMRKGGDSGPAVVPGDLETSLLVKAVKYDDELLRMPPKGKLPASSIATLAQWVKDGAVGPHAAETSLGKKSPGVDFESAGSHWAYRPIRRPELPAVHDRAWLRSPVDSFIAGWARGRGADTVAAGRSPHPDPPRLLRPDRLTADRRGGRGI